MANTMRSGFTPYTGRERTAGSYAGRASASARDGALAVRRCGRTVLAVFPAEGTLHKLLNRGSDQTGYALIALGNRSRDAKHIGTWDTFKRAEEAMQAYSPRYGLLKGA